MKTIKWFIDLANAKPLLFSIAILLVAVITLASVVQYQNRELNSCNYNRQVDLLNSNRRMDSIIFAARVREYQQNEEMKKVLNDIIEGYKRQIDEHEQLNTNINTAVTKTNKQLKTLKDERQN